MEDTEKMSELKMLEEATEETEETRPSTLETDTSYEKDAVQGAGNAATEAETADQNLEFDGTSDVSKEEDMTKVGNEGSLTEGTVESSLDVDMGEIPSEDTKNNNINIEELLNLPADSLGEGDEQSDIPEGTILSSGEGTVPISESSLNEQFMSQTDNLVVQNEPPPQLMEETDMPEEGQENHDDLSSASAQEVCSPKNTLPVIEEESEPQSLDSDVDATSLLQQGETNEAVDDLGHLQDELNLHLGSNQVEEQSSQQLDGAEKPTAIDMQGVEELPTIDMQESEGSQAKVLEAAIDDDDNMKETATDSMQEAGEFPVEIAQETDEDLLGTEQVPPGNTDGTEELPEDSKNDDNNEEMDLPLVENESDPTGGVENFAMLAGADHVEGSLGDLGGKILLGADGSVHLLGGQEALQGMQLMEGDDKPEDMVAVLRGEAAQRELEDQLQAALLKQEEMKQETDKEANEPEEEAAPNAESDALATLASAALDHQAPPNGIKSESETVEVKKERDEPQWMDVGICKGTHCTARTYYIPNEGQTWDKDWEGITTNTLPDHRAFAKLELEAGKAYKFRVAAINSCGRGPWSEISAFRTCMPGVPGAPSAIKISKTVDGAHLSWEPPSTASGVIEDYTVYMAVRNVTTDSSQVVSSGATQLAFVRIYQGAENQCSVNNDTLTEAHIDTTTKPAILFRIAARNEKGLGPAIQVRWLQDVGVPNVPKLAAPSKRPGPELKPHTNIKRKCD